MKQEPLETIYSLPLSRIAVILIEARWLSSIKRLLDDRGLDSWRTKINCSARHGPPESPNMISVIVMARSVPEGHTLPDWGDIDQILDEVIVAQSPSSPKQRQAAGLTNALELIVRGWTTDFMQRLTAEAEQLGLFVVPEDRTVVIGGSAAAAFMDDGSLVSATRITCACPDDQTEGVKPS